MLWIKIKTACVAIGLAFVATASAIISMRITKNSSEKQMKKKIEEVKKNAKEKEENIKLLRKGDTSERFSNSNAVLQNIIDKTRK